MMVLLGIFLAPILLLGLSYWVAFFRMGIEVLVSAFKGEFL